MQNVKLKTHTETPEGKAMFCIVREFLDFFNLNFTVSVFESESYSGTRYKYEGRNKIIEDLGISKLGANSQQPILLQLIHLLKSKFYDKVEQNSPCEIQKKNNDNNTLETSKVDLVLDGTQSAQTISENIEEVTENSCLESPLATPKVSHNLNETFIVSVPSAEIGPRNDINNGTFLKTNRIIDEISPNCSSTDSSNTETDFEKNAKTETDVLVNQTIEKQSLSESEFSPPILKETKCHLKLDNSVEKLKFSPQKTEKIKSKNTLPPLQINKTRSNEALILPSLYNKEFKEKANIKEVDKLLDMNLEGLDNYEEDFMSGSELELSIHREEYLKPDKSKGSVTEDLVTNGNSKDCSENISDNLLAKNDNETDDGNSNISKVSNESGASVTSEDFNTSVSPTS